MKRASTPWLIAAVAAAVVALQAGVLLAGDWDWLDVTRLWKGTPIDVHMPESDKQCGHEGCIERTPVEECVVGKKLCYKTTIRYEYVAIPEVRYRWEFRCIHKEIPTNGCKTVCETEGVEHRYAVERWDKQPGPCGGEVHCKTCVPQSEKLDTKKCKEEPGETIIKVKYFSCVKVPYTVYRQVKQEVCVKQPRYEKVEVPIKRYVCEHCGGLGCKFCNH
jgi:hypothetical protein